jgi:hypothetical protein
MNLYFNLIQVITYQLDLSSPFTTYAYVQHCHY